MALSPEPSRDLGGNPNESSRRLLRPEHQRDDRGVPLIGGLYGVDVIGTWGGGSVKLQRVTGDGSSLVSVSSATDFTANGYATANLTAGQYKLIVDTASGVYAEIRRISGE
jgi:hypothetical protein